MTTLRKIPNEDAYYNFKDWVELDETKFIICGNSHFKKVGDSKLIAIVEGNYYDEDTEYYDKDTEYDYKTFEELKKAILKKATGKVWETYTMRGYSQSDWQTLYYVVGEATDDEIEEIENFYMGKVTGFKVEEEDCHEFVPDSIVWEGKKAICDYLGLKAEETTIYKDVGYEKVYKYKEIV